MKPKFDGYAAQYDAWFMENENVFQSEFRLFEKAIGDISGKRVLSVGFLSGNSRISRQPMMGMRNQVKHQAGWHPAMLNQ